MPVAEMTAPAVSGMEWVDDGHLMVALAVGTKAVGSASLTSVNRLRNTDFLLQ